MSQDKLDPTSFSPDIRLFLSLLHEHGVRYVIVGGEAVIFYGYARLTGDIDIFYSCDKENAARLFAALAEFWDDNIPGVASASELEEEGIVLQFGVPPHRIDLLNRIDGVSFGDAWKDRKQVSLEGDDNAIPLQYIGLAQLIQNKESSRRAKDLDDLAYLRRARDGS